MLASSVLSKLLFQQFREFPSFCFGGAVTSLLQELLHSRLLPRLNGGILWVNEVVGPLPLVGPRSV